MSTKLQKQKRETKQVRVSTKWHQRLKVEAALRKTVIAALLDEICKNFFPEDLSIQSKDYE